MPTCRAGAAAKYCAKQRQAVQRSRCLGMPVFCILASLLQYKAITAHIWLQVWARLRLKIRAAGQNWCRRLWHCLQGCQQAHWTRVRPFLPFLMLRAAHTCTHLAVACNLFLNVLKALCMSSSLTRWPFVIPAGQCRFAAKVIAKRWGPGAVMEPMFVRRVQHEVDISNHVGKQLESTASSAAYANQESPGI